MRNILSINFNHDGAGVILSEGRIAAFVNTERFSRKKKHPGIRDADLTELLDQASLRVEDLDCVLLCNLNNMDAADIPNTHGTDLKETWLDFRLDAVSGTVHIRGTSIPCLVNPTHHALHASVAYYTSPFQSAITFCTDPVGCAAFICENQKIRQIEDVDRQMLASVGYAVVAYQLFGSSLFGAGKVMGLAPYGKPSHGPTVDYRRIRTMEQLNWLAQDNAVLVSENGLQLNATLAYHVQRALEIQLTDILRRLYAVSLREGISPNICLSGGTALNSVANQIAFLESGFKGIHLHPACGDDGTAIGAALWYWHNHLGHPKRTFSNRELMYSIRTYDEHIDSALTGYSDRLRVRQTADYIDIAAELLASGKIIGWFQDASEIGPRALGNRSILADPRGSDMKDRLNARVKFREGFRPFAPSVLNEHAAEWFGLMDSPFMLRVCDVLKPNVPAITHIDRTARIQTVDAQDNPNYHALIQRFFAKTGVPLLLNTSFNIKGEPIVETPLDAVRSFLHSGMDCLVFKNRVVCKTSALA